MSSNESKRATLAALVVLLLAGSTAVAQCTKDTDCKGDRVCVSGACVDATTELPPPPAPAVAPRPDSSPGSSPGLPADGGWAFPAAIIGFVSSGLVLTLALGSEATRQDQIPSLPLGILATVTAAAAGPVVFAGGASARSGDAPRGSIGLRITGWVTYGVALALAGALIFTGVLEITAPPGLITGVGLLGAGSLVCFSLDALFSRSRVERLVREMRREEQAAGASARATTTERSIRIAVAPSISRDGRVAPVVALAASF